MRVLHVIPSVSAVRGGPSQAVLELVAAARQSGHEMEILATNDDGPGLLDVPSNTATEYQGAAVRFFPRFSPPLRPLREFAYSAPLARWLRKHVRDYQLIHVHALFSHAPSAAMSIARRASVPYIVRPSGLLCRWSLQQSRLRKFFFLRLCDRRNLNGSAAIEYTAEQERDEAHDLQLTPPGFVMPYGLHPPVFLPDARARLRQRLSLPADEPVVLFLSRLHPKKGVHHLIASTARLASQRRFTVVIAGSGDAVYEAELKKLAAEPALSGRIHFVGFATGEWKQVLLQGADLFVLLSYSESFAIAVMEALAVGTPVITTPGVPLELLIRKFNLGWICRPEETALTAELGAALDTAADPQAGEERRRRSRQLIGRNFFWPVIVARLNEVYRAVLEKRPLPGHELNQMTIQGVPLL